jgi:hypothetical protein
MGAALPKSAVRKTWDYFAEILSDEPGVKCVFVINSTDTTEQE